MSNDTDKKKPSYEIIAVKDLGEGRSHFTKLGASFAHADGKGHSLDPVAYPAPGVRLILREPSDRLQEMKDNVRDDRTEARRDDRRDEKRDDKRSSSTEDRPARDTGPRYER